jgi:hypothetical protein
MMINAGGAGKQLRCRNTSSGTAAAGELSRGSYGKWLDRQWARMPEVVGMYSYQNCFFQRYAIRL